MVFRSSSVILAILTVSFVCCWVAQARYLPTRADDSRKERIKEVLRAEFYLFSTLCLNLINKIIFFPFHEEVRFHYQLKQWKNRPKDSSLTTFLAVSIHYTQRQRAKSGKFS